MSEKLNKTELNDVNGGSNQLYKGKIQAYERRRVAYGSEFTANPSYSLETATANVELACSSYLNQFNYSSEKPVAYFEYKIVQGGTVVKTGTITARY